MDIGICYIEALDRNTSLETLNNYKKILCYMQWKQFSLIMLTSFISELSSTMKPFTMCGFECFLSELLQEKKMSLRYLLGSCTLHWWNVILYVVYHILVFSKKKSTKSKIQLFSNVSRYIYECFGMYSWTSLLVHYMSKNSMKWLCGFVFIYLCFRLSTNHQNVHGEFVSILKDLNFV